MKSKHSSPQHPLELRRRAEGRLNAIHPLWQSEQYGGSADLQRLRHELEVHQIELEMQSEALREAQAATETALRRSTELFDFAPTGYFNLAPDGSILAVNRAGTLLAGLDVGALMGLRFATLVDERDRAAFDTYLQSVFGGGGRKIFEGALSRAGAEPIHIHMEAVISADGTEARATVLDNTERHKAEIERSQLIAKLQKTLEQVQSLSEMVPICARCKRIRNDDGYWGQVENYITEHFDAAFTHGFCPACFVAALEEIRNVNASNLDGTSAPLVHSD